MKPVYTTDPATGEEVALNELSRRHGISVQCISSRYKRGLRGAALVESMTSKEAAAARSAKHRAEKERQQAIIDANSAALMRPFRHIAGVSKMVGGAL